MEIELRIPVTAKVERLLNSQSSLDDFIKSKNVGLAVIPNGDRVDVQIFLKGNDGRFHPVYAYGETIANALANLNDVLIALFSREEVIDGME